MLDYADEVTTSTEYLKEHIRNHYNYKGKVTVVPNCYREEEWDIKREERADLRIGFAGASAHVSDLIGIIPVIKKLQEKHSFTFYIMGFGQSTYEEWLRQYRYIAQPEATLELRKLDELLKDIDFVWVPFVDYAAYPQTLKSLSLDIGICPLQDTPFNNARSASKALEYNLCGTLTLASDSIPYRTEPTSVLVKDGEWEETLEHYIRNPDIAKETQRKHLEWIRENKEIKGQVGLLREVYIV